VRRRCWYDDDGGGVDAKADEYRTFVVAATSAVAIADEAMANFIS
jgi:hypothetical protein